MVRLSRAEMQGNNRAKVLAAALAEFTERGYRETRIDAIADRAELTRRDCGCAVCRRAAAPEEKD